MNRTAFILGTILVLMSNGIALVKVALNRSGAPVQTITLTERELRIVPRDELDDSSISLELVWSTRTPEVASRTGIARPVFDAAKLQEMGFDCPPPADPAATRQPLPAVVFVAFEFAGRPGGGTSQLILADASRSLEKLRSQYPESRKYLLVRAVVHAILEGGRDPRTGTSKPYRWIGFLSEILPADIHVPLPYARELSRLKPRSQDIPRYAVTLHYGRNFEPWVAAVTLF